MSNPCFAELIKRTFNDFICRYHFQIGCIRKNWNHKTKLSRIGSCTCVHGQNHDLRITGKDSRIIIHTMAIHCFNDAFRDISKSIPNQSFFLIIRVRHNSLLSFCDKSELCHKLIVFPSNSFWEISQLEKTGIFVNCE